MNSSTLYWFVKTQFIEKKDKANIAQFVDMQNTFTLRSSFIFLINRTYENLHNSFIYKKTLYGIEVVYLK